VRSAAALVWILLVVGTTVGAGALPSPARGEEGSRRAAEARALTDLGAGAYKERKPAEAIDYHTRALAIYRELGLRAEEATSLAAIGEVLSYLFIFEAAIPKYEEAARLYRDLGDEVALARVTLALGRAQMLLGRRETAVRHFEDALKVFTRVGDRERAEEARTLLNRVR